MPKTFYVQLDTIIAVNGPGHTVEEAKDQAEAIVSARKYLIETMGKEQEGKPHEPVLEWIVDEEEDPEH